MSDDPEREIPALLEDNALHERARALKAELASPLGDLLTKIAPADPLGSFRAIAERLRASESSLEMIDGQFAIPEGNYAIAMLGTRESAFDSGAQMRLLAKARRFLRQAIAKRRGGELRLESSGRKPLCGRRRAEREARRLRDRSLLVSRSGRAVLPLRWRLAGLLDRVRSPAHGNSRSPPRAASLVLGNLDGLTMAFGASLMGIAIDYSNHLLIHNRLSTSPEMPVGHGATDPAEPHPRCRYDDREFRRASRSRRFPRFAR